MQKQMKKDMDGLKSVNAGCLMRRNGLVRVMIGPSCKVLP